MSNCASLKKHIQCVLEDKLFASRGFLGLLIFFFDVQHIIKSAPIVMVPNQPPLLVWRRSRGRDSAPRCWSISLCNSKAEKQAWGKTEPLTARVPVVVNGLQITECDGRVALT